MRWFLWLVLVVALVTGALYGVGRFLLKNDLAVTRSVNIERPRATVFAMANDLKIAKEWSPYYAMDPDAEYSFSSDDAGAGQTMRWTSNVRQVGSGRISIVDSTENEAIESIIELGDRATLNSHFEVRRADGGSAVAWSVRAVCAEGWINVPCRYMNLVLQSQISAQLDDGLKRLKDLAEQVPNVDFEGFGIASMPVEQENVIFVDVSIASDAPTFADRASAEADGLNMLNTYIASVGGGISRGDTLVRVFPANNGADGRYRFSVGYPYQGPAPLRLVGVRVGQTPGGMVLRAGFQGRRSQLPLMYQRLDAYVRAHRREMRPGTDVWEVVEMSSLADSGIAGDPVEKTEVFYPLQ